MTRCVSRWVVRFGHQVSAKNPYRTTRHIPNPNVSVKSLQSAAMKWVLGWDEDDNEEDGDGEDDYQSARGSQDEMTLNAAEGGVHHTRRGGSEVGAPLSVLREEEGQGEVSPSGRSGSSGAQETLVYE